jgi:hypothetical protein
MPLASITGFRDFAKIRGKYREKSPIPRNLYIVSLKTPNAERLHARGDCGRRETHQGGDASGARNLPTARLQCAKQIALFEFLKFNGVKDLSSLENQSS